MEKIICAATWYKQLPNAVHAPKNIYRGVVVSGKNHAQIYCILKAMTGKRECTNAEDGCGEFEQGFLTTENRFVGRKEAFEIAKLNDQIIKEGLLHDILYSEFIKY